MSIYNKTKLIALIDKKIADAEAVKTKAEDDFNKVFVAWKKAAPAKFKTWLDSCEPESKNKSRFDGIEVPVYSPPRYPMHSEQKGYRGTYHIDHEEYVKYLNSTKNHLGLIDGDEIEVGPKKNNELIWFI